MNMMQHKETRQEYYTLPLVTSTGTPRKREKLPRFLSFGLSFQLLDLESTSNIASRGSHQSADKVPLSVFRPNALVRSRTLRGHLYR